MYEFLTHSQGAGAADEEVPEPDALVGLPSVLRSLSDRVLIKSAVQSSSQALENMIQSMENPLNFAVKMRTSKVATSRGNRLI